MAAKPSKHDNAERTLAQAAHDAIQGEVIRRQLVAQLAQHA
jgi:hypothetical protein